MIELYRELLWLPMIACVAFATGCGSDQSRFVGTWTAQALPSRLLADGASPFDVDKKAQPSERPTDSAFTPSISLQFYRNGRLDTVTNLPNIQTQKTGQWRLVSFDETKKIATIECELMQQRTQHRVEFIDADTMKLVPPNLAGTKLQLEFKKSR